MAAPSVSYTSKLNTRRILILGGTSGVGFCVAEAALQFGASVILSGSNPTKLASALDRLRKQHPAANATTISGKTCDLSDPLTVEQKLLDLLEFATTPSPPSSTKLELNHIVFTAGDAISLVPLADVAIQNILAISQIRFHAAVILAKHLPKYMPLRYENSLTFTGGTNTDKPMPGWTLMAAVGATVEGLTRGLAVDLKPLRVNTVSLGAVLTELLQGYVQHAGEEVEEEMKRGTLTGQLGKPEDVVEAYLYLMRDRFVTGQVVKTNGGRMLA